MSEVPLCRKSCLIVLFLLFCHRRRHASFPNDVASQILQHNNHFDVEAATPTAPMPTRMLIAASLEGYCWLPDTKSYVFLIRSQPTTNPQCLSTHCDLNGQQWLPWCPTPSTNPDNSHPEFPQFVVCGGTESGAPWWPWEDGSRHSWWGTV